MNTQYLGEKLSYHEIKNKYHKAVKDVESKIRSSRSKVKNDLFDTFEWFVSKSHIEANTRQGNSACDSIRISAVKGQFIRISELYDLKTMEIIPGLWSF